MLSHFSAQFASLIGGLGMPVLAVREACSLLVVAAFLLLFGVELRAGYRRFSRRVMRNSYLTNLGSLLFNDTLVSLLAVGSLCIVASRYAEFGLLSHVDNPLLRAGLSFLALDLSLYGWHLACHRIEALWRFHRVHHSDLSMNVSTAFRLHFMEIVLTTLVKACVVLAMGIETAVFLVSEAIMTLFVMFHHANIRFAGESPMSKVFIVPRLHRAHHSQRRQEHDNNYGAVFSFWDRLFGTLIDIEPAEIGLANVGEHGLWDTIRHGFASLAPPSRPASAEVPVQAMIAEAAYYRAQLRGFQPGQEMSDWILAEREVLSRFGVGKGRHPRSNR